MANHLLRLGVLAKLFFFSLWAARLLLVVGVPSAVMLFSGKIIDYASWEPFFVIVSGALALGSISVYIVVVLLMFPAQLVSVISSRQYGLLPHIRHYLATLIACVFLFLQFVACCILIFVIKSNNVFYLSLLVAILLIASFIVMLSFTRLGHFQFLYFFAVPVLGLYLVPLLKMLPAIALLIILVCVWAMFLGWWFSWHPKKYHQNLIMMRPGELNKHELSFFGHIYSYGNIPQNLELGILFGKFGSSFYQVRMFIIAIVFTGFIIVVMFMLSSRDFNNGLMAGIRVGIAIQIIQIGYNYSLAVFKNINKCWLYFSLERAQLFNAVEQKLAVLYLKDLVAITFIISGGSFFIQDDYLPMKNIPLYLLASLLVTAISFYMVFIVYAKWRGNVKVFYWVNGITMVLLLGSCFLGFEFFAHESAAIYVGYILAVTLVCSGFILVMRQYAKRLWQQVDLVRVAA